MAQTDTATPTGTEQENEKLNCTVEISDVGAWQKKIAVVIPRDEIDAELSKEFKELRQTADVPGFRKGHAPLALVEKRFGTDVADQAKYRLLARAFEQIDEENDFEVLGDPDIDLEKLELPEEGDLKIEYEIEVKPQFELPALESVKIEKPIFEVNKERIDEALQNVLDRFGHTHDVEKGGAKDGDMVLCDVTIKVEGVEEPETLENHTLHVAEKGGVGGFLLEGLDKLLKGVKSGDTKETASTASDTHANEAYRGKKADISITVKTVRRHHPAELNAELLERLGVADEAELRKILEDDLERQADQEVRRTMANQVHEYLRNSINFELPPNLTARHANRVLQRRFYDLLGMGVTQDKIQENLERLRAASAEEAGNELKMTFILDAVADKLDIKVTEAEINGWIAMIAQRQQRRPEKVRDELRRDGRITDLAVQIRQEKAVDRILETAEVVDAPAKKSEPAEKKAAPKKTTKKTTAKADNSSEGDDAEKKPKKRGDVKRKPPSSKKKSE